MIYVTLDVQCFTVRASGIMRTNTQLVARETVPHCVRISGPNLRPILITLT
jgi:hypothetical protein